MKISIVIPAYEAGGRAVELMSDLFDSISAQTYKNYEVIVSDHSLDNRVEEICKKYDFDIIHFYNDRGRGNSSINMNEGIKRSNGDVIKIMHMDDIMINPSTLSQIVINFENNTKLKWGALTFNHNYESNEEQIIRRIIVPSMSSTMGCPSVSFFLNNKETPDLFDENLIIINDHDMHYRLHKKYGEAIIIGNEDNIYITIRMHKGQVSSYIEKDKEQEEWKYFKLKTK